jgi:hypothetical protein
MVKNQWLALFAVLLIALLAGPVCLLIGVLTAPVGIGILMLTQDSPWILNLYPFVVAGEKQGVGVVHFLGNTEAMALTFLEWLSIARIFSIGARGLKPREIVLSAVALVLLVAVLTSSFLSVAGIALVKESGRM